MTIDELIDYLKEFDPETEVHFCYDYGDHWHNLVAPKVRSIDEGLVRYSDYHRMDKVVDNDSEQPDDRRVVLLS